VPEFQIAARLNNQGVRTDLDRDWTRATVREVLSNEKYVGNNVFFIAQYFAHRGTRSTEQ